MEFTFSELLISFLYAIALGFLLGAVYEPVRIIYLSGFNKRIHYFIFDTLFMILCAVITFYFSLAMLEGRVRLFVIFGELTGFVTFYYTVRKILDIFLIPILKFFKKISKKLLKISRKIMYNIKIILNKISNKFVKDTVCFLKIKKIKVSTVKKKKLSKKKKTT